MRFVLALVCAAALAGCQLVYKLPTRQGNVLEQKQLDQLALGMTHEQVLYLLGTPLATSPFRSDRWDYVGYYKSPRGVEIKRVVTLHFDPQGAVSDMEGVQVAKTNQSDPESVLTQERKDAGREGRGNDGDIPPMPHGAE